MINKLLFDHDESHLMVILLLFSAAVLGLVPASDECRYSKCTLHYLVDRSLKDFSSGVPQGMTLRTMFSVTDHP